jgi:hypothetical protein
MSHPLRVRIEVSGSRMFNDGKSASATGHQVKQSTEQTGSKSIHLHRGAGTHVLAAHFSKDVGRKVDPEFAAGTRVVTHLGMTPFLIFALARVGQERVCSLLNHQAGMVCRDSHCFQCRKTRTSLCSSLIGM